MFAVRVFRQLSILFLLEAYGLVCMCMARSDVGLVQLRYLERFYSWLGWNDRLSRVKELLSKWR